MRKKGTDKGKMSILSAALIFLLLVCSEVPLLGKDKGLVAWWKFYQIKNNKTQDSVSQIEDTIEGNFKSPAVAVESALKLDGFITPVIDRAHNSPQLAGNFKLEGLLALTAYSWNRCPIISRKKGKEAGFYCAVEPYEQLSFQVALNEDFSSKIEEQHTHLLKPGSNQVKIEVRNMWSNRLCGDLKLPPEKKFCRTNIRSNWELYPAGLLGPVRLLPAIDVEVDFSDK
jgi:hypothetical protein